MPAPRATATYGLHHNIHPAPVTALERYRANPIPAPITVPINKFIEVYLSLSNARNSEDGVRILAGFGPSARLVTQPLWSLDLSS